MDAVDIPALVREVVEATPAVDLHTHLFPPSHGPFFLSGIDELLTYHYLIAEVCAVLPLHAAADGGDVEYPVTPDAFFALSKVEQADVVWTHLFLRRSPVSEACRGVLTTLSMLGLKDAVTRRDLAAIRDWFASRTPEEHVEEVFRVAGLKYVVMTNEPFVPAQLEHWHPPKPFSKCFRAALRVDPLLSGDWATVRAALDAGGHKPSAAGLKSFLLEYVAVMRPVYLMASTPAGFKVDGAAIVALAAEPTPTALGPLSATSMLAVLMQVAVETSLGLAIKVGAVRGVNPRLRSGGDGVEVADLAWLGSLCLLFPDVKFLVTVLSRDNQHELCVLSRKFPNLHPYGCWWFCNNPSIISSVTTMRLEMLGTSFTAQHSDARVLEQLPYKWGHSRKLIADALSDALVATASTGWTITREDIERDAHALLGGAYEAFIGGSTE